MEVRRIHCKKHEHVLAQLMQLNLNTENGPRTQSKNIKISLPDSRMQQKRCRYCTQMLGVGCLLAVSCYGKYISKIEKQLAFESN